MILILRILELIKWLQWALDLIDMYDARLAAIDGPELVYTETHVKGKEQARKLLEEYKQMPGYEDIK
jgi:hypothetical protein